jgi:GTP-binding protein
VDTGGIDRGKYPPEEQLLLPVHDQIDAAIQEADLLLLVVDGSVGMTPVDQEIAQELRCLHKPVILVVNKMDHPGREMQAAEWYRFGFFGPEMVSSVHGRGVGDLLDRVVSFFPPREVAEEAEAISLSVIGRPNVGKSSLVNFLVGKERVIVSPVAGTTRDAIDTPFIFHQRAFVLIDTAGIRRKAKVHQSVEKSSVLRALKAIERSDVCLITCDVSQEIAEQDKRIAQYAEEAGKAMILVINKWDLITKDTHTMHQFREKIKAQFSFLSYVPMLFVSVLHKQRLSQILPEAIKVMENYTLRVPTAVLNQVIQEAVFRNPPPSYKGRRLRISYVTQVSVKPPLFLFFVNDSRLVHFSYARFLENQLRESFGFSGTPLRLRFKNKHDAD